MTSDANPPAVTFGGQGIAFPVVRSLDRAGVKAYAVGGSPSMTFWPSVPTGVVES